MSETHIVGPEMVQEVVEDKGNMIKEKEVKITMKEIKKAKRQDTTK